MALIKSISGIRGTIGGKPGDNLTPLDIVKFTAAFAGILLSESDNKKIVIGRDGRMSGEMVSSFVLKRLLHAAFMSSILELLPHQLLK